MGAPRVHKKWRRGKSKGLMKAAAMREQMRQEERRPQRQRTLGPELLPTGSQGANPAEGEKSLPGGMHVPKPRQQAES